VSELPSPKQAKPLTMPAYEGFGFHQNQGGTSIAPEAGQSDPEEAIGRGQFRSFPVRALKYADLLA
jgi:hypothetical protein